jgi:hypothetical protein
LRAWMPRACPSVSETTSPSSFRSRVVARKSARAHLA